jgi:hypothetical protein
MDAMSDADIITHGNNTDIGPELLVQRQVRARGLLGQQVRIMLDLEDENAVAEGQLLSICEDGSFVVLDDMGMKHYCWPLLKVAEP